MARTYRKFVKCGICHGSNTKYYRDLNRKCRAKNRQSLRNMLVNYDIETVSDIIPLGEVPIHNDWDEPTDGTFLIGKNAKKNYVTDLINVTYNDGSAINYWNRKFGKYFKNKHYNH